MKLVFGFFIIFFVGSVFAKDNVNEDTVSNYSVPIVREVSQPNLRNLVSNYGALYVGATGSPLERLSAHQRRFGNIQAFIARSSNMKADEQFLLNMAYGRPGNHNKMRTSGIGPSPGYTYAIYYAGAAPGA